MAGKDTYKYHLKQGHRTICRGITYDLTLREIECQQNYPGSRIQQVGRKTTHEAALKWERRGAKRLYKISKQSKNQGKRGNKPEVARE